MRYYLSEYLGAVDAHGCPAPAWTKLARSVGPERYKIELVKRFSSGGRLLELGPGRGGFAFLAKEAGFDVSAIEMSGESCRFLRREGIRGVRRDPRERHGGGDPGRGDLQRDRGLARDRAPPGPVVDHLGGGGPAGARRHSHPRGAEPRIVPVQDPGATPDDSMSTRHLHAGPRSRSSGTRAPTPRPAHINGCH